MLQSNPIVPGVGMKGISDQKRTSLPSDSRGAHRSDAVSGSEHLPTPKNQIALRVGRRLGVPQWVFECGREFRCFLCRIGMLVKLRTVPLVDLGPQFGEDSNGRLIACSRTRGRSADIQSFQNTGYRSPADLEIYLAGWNAGAIWADCNPHSCTVDKNVGQPSCMTSFVHRYRG
jgi:hypothetical protein